MWIGPGGVYAFETKWSAKNWSSPGQQELVRRAALQARPFGHTHRTDGSGSQPSTSYYNVYMSVNVSVRLEDGLAERLRVRARAAGETLSDRLRRYAEEGTRRDEHPLITFRDGPTGRRAGLLGGPDVWEVLLWLRDLAGESDPTGALLEESDLTRAQVEATIRYGSAYPDEIEARIELHLGETDRASKP